MKFSLARGTRAFARALRVILTPWALLADYMLDICTERGLREILAYPVAATGALLTLFVLLHLILGSVAVAVAAAEYFFQSTALPIWRIELVISSCLADCMLCIFKALISIFLCVLVIIGQVCYIALWLIRCTPAGASVILTLYVAHMLLARKGA